MPDKKVVETIYGRTSKYEVVKEISTFASPKFYVRRDGSPYKGSFSSLRSAVAAAQKAAGS